VLRIIGPLVVVSTLALLGSGLALVLVGEQQSRQTLFTILGQRVDTVSLHQGSFAVWAVATGLHVLGRLVSAWLIVKPSTSRVPSRSGRVSAVVLVLALAAGSAGWVLAQSNGWRDQRDQGGVPGQFGSSDND
jgi:hypothetical protein